MSRTALRREALIDHLGALLDDTTNAITVLSAPAGSGKTTLLAQLARQRASCPVAWCTLDGADRDPARFARSILEAVLSSGSPDLVGRAALGGRSAHDPLEEALLVAGCAGHMLLVLDEGEHLQVEHAQAALGRLIAQSPSTLRLVLLTNRAPVLDRQTRVATVSGRQLNFSLAETRALFAQRHLSGPDVELLHAWTEGLPAAVELAAEAYADPRTRDRIVRAALRGDTTPYISIYDMLLDRLDAEQRALLLASSVADPVSCDLGEALTGEPGARAAITELARSGIYFDPIPNCLDCYRHRYPSRNLLRARLGHERPHDVAHLYSAAARWFDTQHDIDRAIDSAVRGDDAMLACNLVRTKWTASTVGEIDSGLNRVASLPAADSATIEVALATAAIAIERGDDDTAATVIATQASTDVPVLRSDQWELFKALLQLRIARDASDSGGIREHCSRVQDWIDEHPGAEFTAAELPCLVRRARAEAELIDGDLDASTDLLERVYREATVTGLEEQTYAATASLAVVTALAGRVRQAGALVDELGDTSSVASTWSKGVAAVARGIHEYHADNPLAASAAAATARGQLRPGVHGDVVLPMLRARLKASIGDEAGAGRLRTRTMARATPRLVAAVSEALGLSMISSAEAADPVTDEIRGQHPYSFARRLLRIGQSAYEEQRWDEAWSAIDHALALVDRHRYHRIAVDSGLELRPTLRGYIAQAGTYTPLAWQLLQRLPSSHEAGAVPNVETLTDRELAVLRHLPSMKSNQEIAAEMYFSVNTIKTHLKSIYRKLGVNRRRDAVEEARARSLL